MEYWTLKQVAERWQVSEPTLRRWLREGLVHALKVGRQLRFTQAEVDRMEASWKTQLEESRERWNDRMAERHALNESPAERLEAVSAAMGGSPLDEPGVTMTDNERLYAELDRLSDEEVAALAKEAQEKARAKEDHAYALLGHLNDRRRGVNPDSEKLSTD